jgi:splicing factor 3B subunit 1
LLVQDGLMQSRRIIDRESEYSKRRLDRIISPDRNDAFQMGDKTPDARVRTYADVMREAQLARERDNTMRNIAEKRRAEAEAAEAAAAALDAVPTKASGLAPPAAPAAAPAAPAAPAGVPGKRSRWDSSVPIEA